MIVILSVIIGIAYCYSQPPGTLVLIKQHRPRLVLEWVTLLVCQFLTEKENVHIYDREVTI